MKNTKEEQQQQLTYINGRNYPKNSPIFLSGKPEVFIG